MSMGVGFVHSVGKYIEDNHLLKNGEKVLVGVSGGADSVALLRVLLALGYECVAVHCNFHLRGVESDRDQLFVERLCEENGVRLIIRQYDTKGYASSHKCSIEMAARDLRYGDFETIRHEENCETVAVAHHRDDSVETVLLNLMRGTGIRGLLGMKPRNGNVIRPLLCQNRESIERWLSELNQTFVTDSTNLECDFTRNKIRLQLLPLMREVNPSADVAIDSTAGRLREVFCVYADVMEKEISQCRISDENGVSHISIAKLRSSVSPQSVLFEILSPYGFTESQIHDVMESLEESSGRQFLTSSAILLKDREELLLKPCCNCECEKRQDCRIEIPFKDGSIQKMPDGRSMKLELLDAATTEIVKDCSVAMLDAAKLSGSLILRHWHEGDSFVPFGMKGRKLVSDYMTDAKMNLFQKQNQMLLCNENDIVWVVGRRTDDRYRVTEKSAKILKITIF